MLRSFMLPEQRLIMSAIYSNMYELSGCRTSPGATSAIVRHRPGSLGRRPRQRQAHNIAAGVHSTL